MSTHRQLYALDYY